MTKIKIVGKRSLEFEGTTVDILEGDNGSRNLNVRKFVSAYFGVSKHSEAGRLHVDTWGPHINFCYDGRGKKSLLNVTGLPAWVRFEHHNGYKKDHKEKVELLQTLPQKIDELYMAEPPAEAAPPPTSEAASPRTEVKKKKSKKIEKAVRAEYELFDDPFMSAEIWGVRNSAGFWISTRSACNALEITPENPEAGHENQRKLIARRRWAKTCTAIMAVQGPGDVQERSHHFIHAEAWNAWLNIIDEELVGDRCREELQALQGYAKWALYKLMVPKSIRDQMPHVEVPRPVQDAINAAAKEDEVKSQLLEQDGKIDVLTKTMGELVGSMKEFVHGSLQTTQATLTTVLNRLDKLEARGATTAMPDKPFVVVPQPSPEVLAAGFHTATDIAATRPDGDRAAVTAIGVALRLIGDRRFTWGNGMVGQMYGHFTNNHGYTDEGLKHLLPWYDKFIDERNRQKESKVRSYRAQALKSILAQIRPVGDGTLTSAAESVRKRRRDNVINLSDKLREKNKAQS